MIFFFCFKSAMRQRRTGNKSNLTTQGNYQRWIIKPKTAGNWQRCNGKRSAMSDEFQRIGNAAAASDDALVSRLPQTF